VSGGGVTLDGAGPGAAIGGTGAGDESVPQAARAKQSQKRISLANAQ